jgi:hypothetical protein
MFGELFTQSSVLITHRRLGNEARALNVKAAGYSQVNVWSVVYRADGFVGAVTIVGPDASQASAKKLASQAYAYARQSLS